MRKKATVVLVLIVIFIISLMSFFIIYNKYLPVSLTYTEQIEDIRVVIDDKTIEPVNEILLGDTLYFPYDFVIKHINNNFYLDKKEKILTYTDYNETVRIYANKNIISINGEKYKIDNPFIFKEDLMYIPSGYLVNKFGFTIEYIPSTKTIIIDTQNKPLVYGQITSSKLKLYSEPSKKNAPIILLNPYEKVRIFDYSQGDEWLKVRSQTGFTGFVVAEGVTNITRKYCAWDYDDLEKEVNINKRITMVWHQVFNEEGNKGVSEEFSNVKGLNVISPTWFSIKNSDGDIKSIASEEYVNWAHNNGYEIWALIDNGFDSMLTNEVLQSTEKRQYVIEQIVHLAKEYNLDGINIDFENISVETGTYYVQFIKELAPFLRLNNITSSVDVYVPSSWTSHYKRNELAKVMDYIIIMGYDEHWAGSDVSGSVSSIGFVDKAIKDTLREVPKNKIILGVPFYTRLWVEEEVNGDIQLSSKAMGMESVLRILNENNVELVWSEETGQYYGEYYKENKIYKVWLEEEESLRQKLNKAKEYDIAGISAWKKGLEKDIIWQLFGTFNMNNDN